LVETPSSRFFLSPPNPDHYRGVFQDIKKDGYLERQPPSDFGAVCQSAIGAASL
jgi:hypothetical protein